ncbi:Ig-like domain-containing protein [Kitasatospora sp. NPDC054939]
MRPIRKVVAAAVLGGMMVLTSACDSNGGGSAAAKADLGAGAGAASSSAAAPSSAPAAPTTAGGTPSATGSAQATGSATPAQPSPTQAPASSPAGSPPASAAPSGSPSSAPAKPRVESRPSDNITDNATYGVGMIVSVTFDKDVKNKEAAARAIAFETNNGTAVKGHWFGNRRIDFRPADYWKPGTKVTVKYRLKDVELAPGVYGGVDRDEPFTIGRSQVSTVDAKTHRMTVVTDGKSSEIAITSGSPQHPTWNGTMVVSSKEGVVRMRSASMPGMTGEPYDLMVPHSMRLTDSGTYVHGNYWSNAIGKDNVSHGCVGLKDVKGGGSGTSAGTFYAGSLIGDVIKVQNSSRGQVAPDNGLSGWNLAWSAW